MDKRLLFERADAYRDAGLEPQPLRPFIAQAARLEVGGEGEPPDVETLIAWEAEGGCEAACPHHCWVEADGTCTHGNPSWLIKLGLI